MFKINRTDVVDTETYSKHINHLGYILYDRDMLERDNAYYKAHGETCYDLARMRMIYKSGYKHCYLDRNNILDYLLDYERCPERFFKTRKSQNYSLDSKRVLGVLREKGFAQEFIDYYIEYKSWMTKCSKMRSILDNCKECVSVSAAGSKLYKLPFVASVQTNRRFNYNNFDIISEIPKAVSNCIGVDKDHLLAWGDFAQSDFRIAYNLFLRSPENDKKFAQYEDKYEALARMLAEQNNEQFDYDKFKRERQLYKRNTLATMYGKRAGELEEDDKFIKKFAAFIEKMPAYAEYVQRIGKYIDLHLPIMVSSYFGFVQQIYDGPNVSRSSVLDVSLNTPVQTGSSEIVISVVNHILSECYAMGYTSDDISLYMTRHDEPIFRISKKAKDVFRVLNDHSTVIVDDWTPLHLDWEFGYNYGVSDDELLAEFNEVKSKGGETIVPREAVCSTEYNPLPALIVFGIAKHETPDGKTVVTFYDKDNNEVMYSLFECNSDEEVIQECKLKMRDAAQMLCTAGFKNVVIFSNFIGGSDYYADVVFNYTSDENNAYFFAANRLCISMVLRYCRKYGLESNVEELVYTNYDQWMNEVKESRYLIAK